MTNNKGTGLPEDGKNIKTGDQPPLLKEESPRLLAEHKAYLGEPRRIRGPNELCVGDVAEFSYESEIRTVFVLNPNYRFHMHGLSLKKIGHHDLMVEIIDRMNPQDEPYAFYNRVVSRPAVQAYDAYRTYDTRKMSNIRVRKYKDND